MPSSRTCGPDGTNRGDAEVAEERGEERHPPDNRSPGSSSAAPALSRTTVWIAAAIFVLGVALRLHSLNEGALFIDEGESTINALTILEHGYPADHYLGLPLFENTLTEPWPESDEYEFRDTSYSSHGMAIYHGWLPLYAIAASLALHGIRPDVVADPPRVQHGPQEFERRIRAARLPAVFFGALFLVAIFLAGRELYGVDAGLAAMLAAALAPQPIWLAQQARYYSAALALATLAAWCAWRVKRRGRWRDFLLAALVFVLLFHTSSLSFAIALASSAPLLAGVLRHERAWTKLGAWAGLVALGLVPWMLWSGYLEHGARIPMARAYLDFPADYLAYARSRSGRIALGAAFLAALGALALARRRFSERVTGPLANTGLPVLFLAGWIVVAYFGFQALVPAASCSLARLSHQLIAAPLLLGGIGLALLARVLLPGRSTVLALGMTLALLAANGSLLRRQQRNPHETAAVLQVVEHLRTLELSRDTKFYALPYQHFSLTYYTGLPIQSVAPVRRDFLERYPGEIVILETTNRLPPPQARSVSRSACRAGVELDEEEAEAWLPALHAAMTRAEVAPLVRELEPEPSSLPAWTAPVVADLLRETARPGHGYFNYAGDNPALFAGHPPLSIDEFWPVFFYRFVRPEERSGARLNYAGRMREASATLLPSTWVVLRCPARGASAN